VTIAAVPGAESILHGRGRELGILVTREEVTVTSASYPPDERIAGPHVHHEHTDAFFVLEGELDFELGREAEPVTLTSGGLTAVPPEVAHGFRTGGDRPSRWLTIHARDGGFGAFMRGMRDGVRVEWDIAPVPAGGGRPVRDAIVSRDGSGERLELGNGDGVGLLRCALPDLTVVEWQLSGAFPDLSPLPGDRGVDSFFVIEGELEATVAGAGQTVGPGTLISLSRGTRFTLSRRGLGPARVLSLHTPSGGPVRPGV
jgi:mannose-6-phosphate isomerase-like protein (cupin superfamily)